MRIIEILKQKITFKDLKIGIGLGTEKVQNIKILTRTMK